LHIGAQVDEAGLHATPHAPQFWMVFVGPQPPSPASGGATQTPPWQTMPDEQSVWDCHAPEPSHS
jgi:hypothetical protein